MKLRTAKDGEGGRHVAIWCVPCDHAHVVPITGSHAWGWNGDRHRPTLTPSLLMTRPGDDAYRCHSVVTDGNIAYCNDSLHALAGKTVPLEDFPVNYGSAWDDQGEPTMRFEIKPPFVLVHDDKPGSHVTLFGTHARFGHGVVRYPFRADQSHFDDATKQYTWAFEATPTHGEILVCATADRECIGEVYETDSEIGFGITSHERHPLGMRLYRIDAAGNKPLTLI